MSLATRLCGFTMDRFLVPAALALPVPPHALVISIVLRWRVRSWYVK
jgi:hypothetical protein